jgi:ubiquinone/menaquinone biosynthesis C-methylase UbiE
MPTHRERVLDQFARKADLFATAPALTDEQTLRLLIDTAGATAQDTMLDVACGAGVLVCAFAQKVKHATGIDLVPAMIDRARALAAEKKLANITWHIGDVLALPFADDTFSLVTSRYAFHHVEHPSRLLAEMKRVCAPGGRLLLADMAASEDAAQAAELNRMEKLRDPSHVCSMSPSALTSLFHEAGLDPAEAHFYRLEFDLDSLLAGSHPLPGDEAKVRGMFERSLYGDTMALKVRRERSRICFSYQIIVLVAVKGERAFSEALR